MGGIRQLDSRRLLAQMSTPVAELGKQMASPQVMSLPQNSEWCIYHWALLLPECPTQMCITQEQYSPLPSLCQDSGHITETFSSGPLLTTKSSPKRGCHSQVYCFLQAHPQEPSPIITFINTINSTSGCCHCVVLSCFVFCCCWEGLYISHIGG